MREGEELAKCDELGKSLPLDVSLVREIIQCLFRVQDVYAPIYPDVGERRLLPTLGDQRVN